MLFLKQSTSVTVKIGPFLDDTDGKTAETGLTIAQADVRLSKNGGDIAQKNDSTSCTHDELGIYNCPLNATDTDTLGRLQLYVHKSGALPVWHEYMVIPANIYDSLFGTDKLQVDVTQIGGDAQSATDLKDFADTGYDPSTHKVATDVSSDVTAIKAKTDNLNFNNDATKLVLADIRDVNDAAVTGVNDFKADVSNLDVAVSTRSSHSAADVADAVWDEAIADHTTVGTFGAKNQKVVPSETIDDYKADVSNLDVAVSTRSSHSAADVWSVATRALTDKSGFSLAADQSSVTIGTVNNVGDKTGYSLSSAGVDAIIDEVVEGSMTLRQALRILLAASAGKSSGGGTSTVNFRDLADSKNRITATVDSNGNRTSVTLDAT